MENKNYIWRPVSEYTGGRVLATNGLDVLIGEINSEGDCESEEGGNTILCGITGFIKIEEMLPEIVESDGESIGKRLIELLKNNDEQHYAKEIAWLEKQGEQKSIWHDEDEEPKRGNLILLIMQSGTPVVAKIIEPNHTFNHGERWAYIDDLLEKQGEQKPAWSEEDELCLTETLYLIRNSYSVDDKVERLSNWVKSLKDRAQPQPNQEEWSEEDIAIISRVISIVKWAAYSDHSHPILNDEGATELIDWLKSIRPQSTWRPSDKQIYSLDRALRFYGKGTAVYDSVKELLEQLKKLKG